MAKAIDRGLENREIVLGVLTEVLDKGNFVHLVLNQALSKYQYLEKPDRAFITRVTEGTLEYLLQIDYIINSYSKTKTEKKTTQKKTETKPAEKSTSAIKSDLPVYLL